MEVFTENGRERTGKDVVKWAQEANKLGITILLTSIDKDGTLKGPEIDLVSEVKKVINVPLVVSGGVGKLIIQKIYLIKHNYNQQ